MPDHQSPDTPPRDQPPALRPPQFTLATLLWMVAAVSGLLAAMTAAGPIGGFALVLLVLAIIAHVAGNAVGTRLREIGSDPRQTERESPSRSRPHLPTSAPPASNLSRRSKLSLTMIVFTICGAVLFGSAGGAILIWLAWGQLNIPTTIVAVASSTVLGGFLGFTTSSFTQIAGGAWWEAQRKG